MTKFQSIRRFIRRRGSAGIALLLIAMVFGGVTTALVHYATADVRLTRHMLEYQRARMAAEMALEYGVVRLRDFILEEGLASGNAALASLASDIVTDFAEMTKPDIPCTWDLKMEYDNTLHLDEPITEGLQVRGHVGDFRYFHVIGHARMESGVEANIGIRLQAVGLFLVRFAIFYDPDLEFFPGANMFISGPVHCNNRLYVGSDGAHLSFLDRVSTVSDLRANVGLDNRTFSGTVDAEDESGWLEPFRRTDEQGETFVLDSSYDSWVNDALDVWGGEVLNGSHGVQELRPPIAPVDEPLALIQRPLTSGSPGYEAATEREKFANKAAVYIRVTSNGTIQARGADGTDLTSQFNQPVNLVTNRDSRGRPVTYNSKPLYTKASNGTYSTTGTGVLGTTERFTDNRENKTIAPVDVYVDRLAAKVSALGDSHGGTPGLVYITRDKPSGSSPPTPAVRVRNGNQLFSSSDSGKSTGLSIVSDLPMYVEGHYNAQNKTVSMLAGDAITMLSPSWQDAYGAAGLDTKPAPVNTINNAVLLTGNTETSGTRYNGGVENVLRFLEKWSGKTYQFRGSIIDLWRSQIATGRWVYGGYYTAPVRDWGYDSIYRTQAPPGIPKVLGLEELEWAEMSPDEARAHGLGQT
ncbi:MAG: hypothetical protein KBA51_04000 [Kiritimatiellae bacterium]|nr:hypothetical protein [Kiritimatiellia bacterium]